MVSAGVANPHLAVRALVVVVLHPESAVSAVYAGAVRTALNSPPVSIMSAPLVKSSPDILILLFVQISVQKLPLVLHPNLHFIGQVLRIPLVTLARFPLLRADVAELVPTPASDVVAPRVEGHQGPTSVAPLPLFLPREYH